MRVAFIVKKLQMNKKAKTALLYPSRITTTIAIDISNKLLLIAHQQSTPVSHNNEVTLSTTSLSHHMIYFYIWWSKCVFYATTTVGIFHLQLPVLLWGSSVWICRMHISHSSTHWIDTSSMFYLDTFSDVFFIHSMILTWYLQIKYTWLSWSVWQQTKQDIKSNSSTYEYYINRPLDQTDKQNMAAVQNRLPLCCGQLPIQLSSEESVFVFTCT